MKINSGRKSLYERVKLYKYIILKLFIEFNQKINLIKFFFDFLLNFKMAILIGKFYFLFVFYRN